MCVTGDKVYGVYSVYAIKGTPCVGTKPIHLSHIMTPAVGEIKIFCYQRNAHNSCDFRKRNNLSQGINLTT